MYSGHLRVQIYDLYYSTLIIRLEVGRDGRRKVRLQEKTKKKDSRYS